MRPGWRGPGAPGGRKCWAGCRESRLWPPASGLPCISAWACASALASNMRMMARQIVQGLLHGDELHRHDIGALVQHLEIRMLAIGSGLAPQHRRGAERKRLALRIDTLAVALHLQLLQIRGQAAQRTVIRRNAAAGEAVEIAVPDVQQAQAHRKIGSQRRGGEVPVHLMGARQQLAKTVRANGDRNGQANGRPHANSARPPSPRSRRWCRCRTRARRRRWW